MLCEISQSLRDKYGTTPLGREVPRTVTQAGSGTETVFHQFRASVGEEEQVLGMGGAEICTRRRSLMPQDCTL